MWLPPARVGTTSGVGSPAGIDDEPEYDLVTVTGRMTAVSVTGDAGRR